jgi:hypothetical protein
MRAADVPVDQEGALGLCRLLLRATESGEPVLRPQARGKTAAKPAFLERFDGWVARARQRDRERYLAQSRDVFELEARIRALERRPYY